MTLMSSQFGLDDMEALLWGPSSPTADPLGTLLHMDEDGTSSMEGGASPLSSSFSSSPPPLHSPPPSPSSSSLLHQSDKPEVDMSLSWLPANELGHSRVGVSTGKEDAFSGLDWMAERVDLNEFDLDSLMDCCGMDELPSSPEDIMASLECPIELDSLPLPGLPALHDLPPMIPVTDPFRPATPVSQDDDPQEAHSPPPCVPEFQEEMEIKSEPVSPAPSPSPSDIPPSSPTFILDVGSEVDVSDCDSKPVVLTKMVSPELPPQSQVPRIVLSLSPTRIVLLLTSKEEVVVPTTAVAIPELASITTVSPLSCSAQLLKSSPAPAPTSSLTKSARSRPYPSPRSSKPSPNTSPSSSTTTTVNVKVKSSGGGAPKEKRLKKMEQNKTAATRYRQKKRSEQEMLNAEYAELESKNRELEEKADSLAREIQYLKELMEEVRLARSLKGGGASDP